MHIPRFEAIGGVLSLGRSLRLFRGEGETPMGGGGALLKSACRDGEGGTDPPTLLTACRAGDNTLGVHVYVHIFNT
jgi:hypothetical protein